MKKNLTILLVGCGEMGGALLKGWINAHLPHVFHVITPRQESVTALTKKALWFPSITTYEEAGLTPDLLIFAIRPRLFEDVIPLYQSLQKKSRASVISIMAGIETSRLEHVLDLSSGSLIRAMPNLPAAVAKGVTGLFYKGNSPLKLTIHGLFKVVGEVVEIPEEGQFNDFTAFLGCGPGIFYEICRAFTTASKALSIPGERETLMRALFLGCASYLNAHPHSFKKLVEQVAVPGGMTEQAVRTLQKNNALEILLKEALSAAKEQGKKLA